MTLRPHRHAHVLQLETLTPVAIGNGQQLDPLRYTIVRHEDGSGTLHFIDLDQWLEDHAEDKGLQRVLEGQPLELRAYLQQSLEKSELLERYSLQQREVADAGLVSKFMGKVREAQSRHQLQIAEAFKNPLTGRLVLPGSSLKGALVTPIIDHLEREHRLGWKKEAGDPRAFRRLMEEVFGKITDSAFKALRLADLEFPADAGGVMTAIERRRRREEPGTPKLDTEAIAPKSQAFGLLTLGFDEKSSGVLSIPKLNARLDWEQIRALVTRFYRSRFEEEWDWFYTQPWMVSVREALGPVRERVQQLDPGRGDLLLRVGHYSHSRCVTIENSIPWAKLGRDRQPQGPNTTRTLANGRLPFGWVLIQQGSWEQLEEHRNRLEAEWQRHSQQQYARSEALREQRQAAELAEQARLEQERREAEAEAAKPAGERLLPEVAQLQNWGEVQQFAERQLKELDPAGYVPELGEAFREKALSFEIPKKKLKLNPDEPQKRADQVEEWLKPFTQ